MHQRLMHNSNQQNHLFSSQSLFSSSCLCFQFAVMFEPNTRNYIQFHLWNTEPKEKMYEAKRNIYLRLTLFKCNKNKRKQQSQTNKDRSNSHEGKTERQLNCKPPNKRRNTSQILPMKKHQTKNLFRRHSFSDRRNCYERGRLVLNSRVTSARYCCCYNRIHFSVPFCLLPFDRFFFSQTSNYSFAQTSLFTACQGN